MSEKRFRVRFEQEEGRGEIVNEKGVELTVREVVDLLNKLYEENEQLKKQLSKYDKLKISIFNKDKGDWKWNDNNDIILNLRTGNKFYLRSSGAVENLVGLLNEQQDTIITLKRRLEKINGSYGHLTHRKGLTANEWVIEAQEEELKKKDEQISDWIEQHSKDIVKIGEQQSTISALKDIFKDIITYSEWDLKKPYCSLGIAVDKKTYYKIREILNE